MRLKYVIRYYSSFRRAIPFFEAGYPRVTHPSAANPLPEGSFIARLACVRHAASVRPEPGSNSQFESFSLSLTTVALS